MHPPKSRSRFRRLNGFSSNRGCNASDFCFSTDDSIFLLLPGSPGKDLIQWLSNLSQHGIDVAADHWLAIAEDQSEDKALEIIQLYSRYLDGGRLDKQYFQPGWTIPSQPQESKPQHKIPQIKDLQPEIPEYQYLIKALNDLKLWNESAYKIFPNDLVLFKGDIHPA